MIHVHFAFVRFDGRLEMQRYRREVGAPRRVLNLLDQRLYWQGEVDAAAIALLDYVVQRLTPFALLQSFKLGVVFRRGVSHQGVILEESGRATILLF